MRFRSHTFVAAALAAAVSVPAAAQAAGPPIKQVEQINRATGGSGAFGLFSGQIGGLFGPVSNDGRYASFGVYDSPDAPNPAFRFVNPGDGLYVRDIVANTTTRFADGSSFFTALDGTGHLFSFITKQSFDRADTNGAPDLYAYERTTGQKFLISRAGGLRGAALGVTSVGAVLKGSMTAVFGTTSGVYRRNLLTGQNTKISGGYYGNTFDEGNYRLAANSFADDQASADGKVVSTSEGVFAPGHTTPAPVDPDGSPYHPLVADSGATAVWVESGAGLGLVRILNTATGAITTLTAPAAMQNLIFGALIRLTADGQSGVFVTFGSDFQQKIVVWNFATGAVTPLTLPQGAYSHNLKYAISGTLVTSGAIVVVPATGGTLPGTVDAPSPNAYVSFTDSCDYAGQSDGGRVITVTPEQPTVLPTTASTRIKVWNGAGQVVVDQTIPTPPLGDDVPTVTANVGGTGAFRLDITVKLADGRTTTETTRRPAAPGC